MESMLAGPTFSSHSQWQAFNPNGFLPGFLMGDYSVVCKLLPFIAAKHKIQSLPNLASEHNKVFAILTVDAGVTIWC